MESLYLHIGNGGVSFIAGTDSEGMLALQIEATHMGNTTNSMKILTNAESMTKIGQMLIEAAREEHEVYCCAAKWDDPDKVPQAMSSEDTLWGETQTEEHD